MVSTINMDVENRPMLLDVCVAQTLLYETSIWKKYFSKLME